MEQWRQCGRWLILCQVLPHDHRVVWPSAVAFDLAQALRDGVLLCQLLHQLCPGSVDLKDINFRPQMSQVRFWGSTGWGGVPESCNPTGLGSRITHRGDSLSRREDWRRLGVAQSCPKCSPTWSSRPLVPALTGPRAPLGRWCQRTPRCRPYTPLPAPPVPCAPDSLLRTRTMWPPVRCLEGGGIEEHLGLWGGSHHFQGSGWAPGFCKLMPAGPPPLQEPPQTLKCGLCPARGALRAGGAVD